MKTSYLLFPLLLLLSACDTEEKTRETAPELPNATVTAVSVITAAAPHNREVTGTIQAVQRAVISARITADIITIPVTTGQQVTEGELLVELDRGSLAAGVREAEIATAQAQRNLNRESRLLKKHAATAEGVKNLRDALRISQAKLNQAKEALGYARLHAPFSGVITAKPVNPGDLAMPGMPLLSIENPDRFEVLADIPETLLGKVKQGEKISFSVPSLQITLQGEVREISPALNPASRTATATLSIIDDTTSLGLYSGMFATVALPADKRAPEALFVPEDAIRHYGQIEQVFVLQQGKASMRIVRSGTTRLENGRRMVEILSGLEPAEQVLLSDDRLQNGQPVTITE